MDVVRCTTQAELDAALQRQDVDIWLVGAGRFEVSGSSQVTAYDLSQVTAFGSSQVRAYGSSQVRAYDSSQVTAYRSSQVTASGSSQVTAYDLSQVTAYGSSQVTAFDSSQVRASGSSQVTAYGSSQVTASRYVAVTVPAHARVTVEGGVRIEIPRIEPATEWCEYYGLPVVDGVVTLYKAVRDDYRSSHGVSYAPGAQPVAHDWEPTDACTNGLFFVPRPVIGLRYDYEATRYVACPVAVDTIVVLSLEADQIVSSKVKAPRVVGPCVEVDIDGTPLPVAQEVGQ